MQGVYGSHLLLAYSGKDQGLVGTLKFQNRAFVDLLGRLSNF